MQITDTASFPATPATNAYRAAATAKSDAATALKTARRDRLIGMFLMAVLPAAFWTAMFALIAPALGYHPTAKTLVITALALASFLAAVAGALTSSSNEHV